MSFSLAKTTFSTRADETLAALDVYGKNDSKVVNLTPAPTDALETSSISGLKGGNLSANLKRSITTGKAVAKTADGFLKDLNSAKNMLSSLKSLPTQLQSSLLRSTGPASLQANINGTLTQFKSGNLTSLKGLGELVSAVSGAAYVVSNLSDKNVLKNIGVNLVREGTRIGLTDVYATLSQGIEDKGVLSEITRRVLPIASASGSINLLSNLAAGAMRGNINSMMPGFKQQFFSQFSLPPMNRAADYTRLLGTIGTSMGRIDPAWNTARLGEQTVINMNDLNGCSRDTGKLLRAQASARYADFSNADPYAIDTSAIPDRLTQTAVLYSLFDKAATPNSLNTDKAFIGLFGTVRNPHYVAPPTTSTRVEPDGFSITVTSRQTKSASQADADYRQSQSAPSAWGGRDGGIMRDFTPQEIVSVSATRGADDHLMRDFTPQEKAAMGSVNVEAQLRKDFPYVPNMQAAKYQSRAINFGGLAGARTLEDVRRSINNTCTYWEALNEPANVLMEAYYQLLAAGNEPAALQKKTQAKAIFAENSRRFTAQVLRLIDEARALGSTDSYVLPTSGPQF